MTACRLDLWVGEVVAIDLQDTGDGCGPGARLRLADGRAMEADKVVLAVGHTGPVDPAVRCPEFFASARCVRDPCAPRTHAAFIAACTAGRLHLRAGRLQTFEMQAEGVDVAWMPRGTSAEARLRVNAVVNCTGPSPDLARSGGTLVQQLLQSGHMVADALRLGACVGADYSLTSAEGSASPVLHAIGPLLKAREWEAVAVPELRAHARRLAAVLLGQPPA